MKTFHRALNQGECIQNQNETFHRNLHEEEFATTKKNKQNEKALNCKSLCYFVTKQRILTKISTDSDESNVIPECIQSEATDIIGNLLPERSKEAYMRTYNDFNKWKSTKGVKSVSESVLLVYFQHLLSTKKPSSLWCIYSMLKSTISIRHNVEIKNYTKLLAFLKRKSEGHRAKKSKVFTSQNVETFLNEAPDHKFLAVKVSTYLNTYLSMYLFITF